MNFRILFILAFTLLSFGVKAHGPTPQKADESIVIDASIEKTWAVLKEFDLISSWHPEVKSSTGEGKNVSDSVRNMTLLNDAVIEESLDYYSDADHEYNYRLKTVNVNALPVSSYTSSIKLIAEGDKTLVKWKSRFYRGDTGNTPPEKLSDKSAVKAMKQFIQKGLEGLKESLE